MIHTAAQEPIETVTLTDVPEPVPRVDEEMLLAYDPERPGRTWNVLGSLALLLALSMPIVWTS